MPYATGECDWDGEILPKNELIRVTETKVVGSYVNGRSKTKTGEIYLCAQHYEMRRAAIAAANMRRWAFWAFVLFMVVVVVIWLGKSAGQPQKGAASLETTNTTAAGLSAPVTPSLTDAPPAPSPSPTPSPPTESNTPIASATSEPSTEAPPSQEGPDDYPIPIQRAIVAALNAGEPRLWQDRDQSGWVTVSALGGRDNTCRSFQVIHGDVKDHPINVCKRGDATWASR